MQVTIDVRYIELLALKKLSLVSHALAERLNDFRAKEEQGCLARTLDDVIRRVELGMAANASAGSTAEAAASPSSARTP